MKKTIFLFLLLTSYLSTFAQNSVTVKGIVSDGQNSPLPGATVSEKGTKNSTITSIDGAYQINIKPNAILVFSFLGTKTTEQKVNNKTIVNARLIDEANNLNEVVVVGYGTKARKDLTGAISSIKGEELAKTPVQNVAQALQGKIAGMQVTMSDGSPGGVPSIRIRGGISITQSNEPLYVVDGIPQTGGLAFLDPMDIESIDVLKDAGSTSIYGAQGANGVVLVTTKRTKEGKLKLSYETYSGFKKITRFLPMMNPYQYVMLQYERALGDATKMQSITNNYGTFDQFESLYKDREGINWQKEIFGRLAANQYHKINISGGSDGTSYNAFYSVNKDEGTMLGTESMKHIAKLVVNYKLSEKFSVTGIVNYSNQKISGMAPTEGENARLSMLQNLLQYRPMVGINGSDDDLREFTVDPLDNQSSPAFQSPFITIETQKREYVRKAVNMSLQLQYNLSPDLVYRGLVSYNDLNNNTKFFNDYPGILSIRNGGPFGGVSNVLGRRFNYNNTLTYNKNFNKNHRFDATVGQEYINNYSELLSVTSTGLPIVNLGWDRLDLGTVASIPSTFAEEDKLLSYFGKTNYSFKNKYLLSASLRTDGSSKFGSENQWGIFPSFSAAWKVNNEGFMKNVTAISDFKFRFSFGQAGNNRIANYVALGILNSGNYPLNNTLTNVVFQGNLPNPELKWESTQSTNLGLDLGFFRQRIALTIELYENRSKDLLFYTRIPASSGFKKQFQNIGSTSNRGIEFTLNTVNIRNADFNWNTSFNIAFNNPKVLSLSDGETSLVTNSFTTTNDYILQVGKPVGQMYGYISDGLYQVNDFDYNTTTSTYTLKSGVVSDAVTVQPGFIKFKDLNGDGVVNDLDRTIIGNSNPKYTGGISNNFSYKGIDLSIFLDFTVGNDIYNANYLNNANLSTDNLNTFANIADRWTTINATGQRITDPTELAAANVGKTIPSYIGNKSQRLYSDIIEDGSFLRINNISLGYSLPKKWLKDLHISNLRIYFTANNLQVFTKYSGYDPEVSITNSAITRGVDFSAYPRAKSFITGLNISL